MNTSENPENQNQIHNQQIQENQQQQQQVLEVHQQQQNTLQNNTTPILEMQQYQYQATSTTDPFTGRAEMVFPNFVAPPQPWNIQQVHHHDPFFFPPSSSTYAGLFTRRPSSSLQFYDGLLSDALGPMVGPGVGPFGLQAEINKMTAQEIMDAKALAASKSHSEAERRRRERINNHLAKLRSLLPSTTKTDKASLLAEVIQHVKELRRQTSIIAETSTVPTETDELDVDASSEGQDGMLIFKASICCDDRSDLLPDLIKALKALRLRTLKAEITTMGGRVKNVLFITQDSSPSDEHDGHEDNHGDDQHPQCTIAAIQEALKAVMEKSGGDDSTSGNAKRQRTANINIS